MRRPRDGGSGPSAVLEAAKELHDQEKFEESPLASLLARMAGSGSAKVYRVREGDGKEVYACSIPVTDIVAGSFEDVVGQRCGGGDYVVKFYNPSGSKNHGSIDFAIDPAQFPPRKTQAEVKREGGPVPTTIGELLQVVQSAVAAAVSQQPRPADTSGSNDREWFKAMFQQQERTIDRLERAQERIVEAAKAHAPALAAPAAPVKFGDQVREVVEVMRSTQSLLGGGGGGGEGDEKRSLALKFLDGPVTKALEKVGDRMVDKLMPDDKSASSSSSSAKTDEPVKMPRNTKPLSKEELARWREGEAAGPPAPKAKDVAPKVVEAVK